MISINKTSNHYDYKLLSKNDNLEIPKILVIEKKGQRVNGKLRITKFGALTSA